MLLYLDIETIADPSLPLALFENRAIKRDESVQKFAALSPTLARIVCVGLAAEDWVKTLVGPEASILARLASVLEGTGGICGFNVRSFDVPTIAMAYIRHGLPMPKILARCRDCKPWESPLVEIADWARWGYGRHVSLQEACVGLGIADPKGECDGGAVQQLYQAGKIEEIAAYCRRDVEATKELAKRLGADK